MKDQQAPNAIRHRMLKSAWQFDARNNKGQPSFVTIQTALGGPRAVVRPPHVSTPMLYLAPMDWLLEFDDGRFTSITDHAARCLLSYDDADVDETS